MYNKSKNMILYFSLILKVICTLTKVNLQTESKLKNSLKKYKQQTVLLVGLDRIERSNVESSFSFVSVVEMNGKRNVKEEGFDLEKFDNIHYCKVNKLEVKDFLAEFRKILQNLTDENNYDIILVDQKVLKKYQIKDEIELKNLDVYKEDGSKVNIDIFEQIK
ncbi:hypothetical protein TUBRATIS_26990 [Tubulinosema ratisbonensis]|uniref:Uncharacterized protein n=1 Tax=Tubulinosema ratisbonensis TaxID=291195 RepID=A0A437AIG0_9MICR|nr:hypothetical protein TUBRATIS_26990 [Tubulinosema ratisbonensis]